jgi:D-amino-acid dehydrogenase
LRLGEDATLAVDGLPPRHPEWRADRGRLAGGESSSQHRPGALGWTLACGSAALVADQIAGRRCAIDDTAFQYRG